MSTSAASSSSQLSHAQLLNQGPRNPPAPHSFQYAQCNSIFQPKCVPSVTWKILLEFVNYAVVHQVESSINSLVSVKCPDSIIKPPEDTTYLMRDYEDEFTGQYYEHGERVKSEEAFCGHTSLRHSNFIRLFDSQSRKPVRLNSYPWVSRYYYSCLVLPYLSSFGLQCNFSSQCYSIPSRSCSFFPPNSLSVTVFIDVYQQPNPIQSYIYFSA